VTIKWSDFKPFPTAEVSQPTATPPPAPAASAKP
jgi:hypothetical protein